MAKEYRRCEYACNSDKTEWNGHALAAFQFRANFLDGHSRRAQFFEQCFAMKSFDFLKQGARRHFQRHDSRLDAAGHDAARIVFEILIEHLLRQRAAFDLRLSAFDLALDLLEDVSERAGIHKMNQSVRSITDYVTLPFAPRARTAALVDPLPQGERGNSILSLSD